MHKLLVLKNARMNCSAVIFVFFEPNIYFVCSQNSHYMISSIRRQTKINNDNESEWQPGEENESLENGEINCRKRDGEKA